MDGFLSSRMSVPGFCVGSLMFTVVNHTNNRRSADDKGINRYKLPGPDCVAFVFVLPDNVRYI